MEATLYPGEIGFFRMQRLLESLKTSYGQWNFRVVHVAGTSGKGSTAAIAAYILKESGCRTGLFLSPFLETPCEQIQINGKHISETENKRLKSMVNTCAAASVLPEFGMYSHFEKLVARAVLYFMKKRVQVAVFETGMGGIYDATNAINSDVAVITTVSYDHERLLGPDIEDIARHKAGIIKNGNCAVVVGEQQGKVKEIICEAARARGVPPLFLGTDFEVKNVRVTEACTTFDYINPLYKTSLCNIKLSLVGLRQAQNAALALTATYALQSHMGISIKNVRTLKIHHPGRFHIIRYKNKKIIMDVAHNPEKISAVVETFKQLWPQKKAVVLFSCKWTKDVRSMAKELKKIANVVVLTQFHNYDNNLINRVMDRSQLILAFQEAQFKSIQWADHSSDALAIAGKLRTDTILITGSFHLLKEIQQKKLVFYPQSALSQ